MARLGDICIQITDGSHNPPMGIEQSNYLMLSSKNIDDDYITLNDPRYLSQEDFEAENRRTNIKPNDLLITIVGTIGRVAIVPNSLTEFCVQRSVAVLKPKPEIVYNRFLMHYLQSMRPYLEQESRGVAQKGIYLKQLSNLSIILPPLDEQRKIAAVLDKVSDLIAKRRQQLDKLDEMVKSRFIELFGDTPDNEKQTMADICKIITDGTHQPPKFTSTGVPFLFVSNIVTNEIHYDAEKFISEETYAELTKRTPIAIGDILLSTVGSYGHPAIVKSDKPFCFQRHIAYLKPNADMVNSEYLRSAILSADVQRQIDERVKGIAQKTLNLSEIRKLRLPVPPVDQQEQFAAFVAQTDKSKLAIEKSLDKLEILKKALMQKYFG